MNKPKTRIAGVALFLTTVLSASAQPTATEAFHLRSECAKCGEKILENNPAYVMAQENLKKGKAPYTVTQQTHYNAKDNHCYVFLNYIDYEKGPFAGSYSLYDGQTGELLATVEVKGLKESGMIFKHERVPESSLPAVKTPESSLPANMREEIVGANERERADAYMKYLMEEDY
jgi:hypothetical protein